MEIIGTIISILPETSGTSAAGKAWRKREFVLETKEQSPKKVHFSVMGDKDISLHMGDYVRVFADISSREFNGRWYTDVTVWKAEPAQAPQLPQVPPPPSPAKQYSPAVQQCLNELDDASGLPF